MLETRIQVKSKIQIKSKPRIQCWRKDDDYYPELLREVPYAPETLFAVGNREVLNAPCFAIVGTRRPTPYGERITRAIATLLVQSGACIVSGMAYGIDSIAHRTALALGGKTVAVLGTGIDVPYPAAHRGLYNQIVQEGLVVSERGAGALPHRGSFPDRNRIIAGLSKVTIIIEAGAKSGTLITAGYAADYARHVAVVPGPIDSSQSEGTNRLIRDGAFVITSMDDVCSVTGLSASKPLELPLAGNDRLVWDAIICESDIDAVAASTRLPIPDCLVAITSLELMGLAETTLMGTVRRR